MGAKVAGVTEWHFLKGKTESGLSNIDGASLAVASTFRLNHVYGTKVEIKRF